MNTHENTTTPADAPAAPADQGGALEASNAAPEQAAQAHEAGSTAPHEASGASGGETPPQASSTQPEAEPAAAAPAAPVSAADDDDWEEQPGDDIGNRVPGLPRDDIGNRKPGAPQGQGRRGAPAGGKPAQGAKPAQGGKPAQGARPAPAGEAGAAAEAEGGAGKKRRRRRRRKGAEEAGQPGAEAADAAAEASDAEAADAGDEEGEEEQAADEAGGQPQPGGEKRKRRKGQGAPPPRERPAFSIGEEVFGKVSKITDHAIWIDIAGKATGLFDRREILDEEPPVEGDQFIATVASTGVRGGMLLLSRAPVQLDQARARAEAALQSGEPIEGFVTGAVKGGLEVDLGGLRAFAPASHVDLRHGADLNYLVGQRLDFIVTQFAKKGRDIVVSRRKMLEEESRKARTEALTSIEPGSLHKGVVRKVVAWGVFVALPDAGGVEGLVHMSEASHDRGAKLADLFKPGAEIDVKVLRVDDKGKLWLSRKAATVDPWDAVKDKYAVGSRHKGKIARLQPFGAFVELEPGIDGLIHTADLSMKPIQHPSEVVKVDDEVDVVVASCDPAGRRIGLHPAPPEGEESEPRQRVQQGRAVKVAVTQVTEGGLVVRVLGTTGRAARGFIPAGHTGTQRGTDLRKEFPIGTQFDAKVIEVDPRRGEAKLSIRALKEDAEKQAYQQYRAGVAREAKFGTFADLMKKS
ncbi:MULTISPECIES: S1 RNA-binding domain-containing protein [Sorangium]|uniref:30S ribosomal protein S1 n=1 Tax=Sorangium cellulosum TaxID=56 RepID=A0A4P2R0S1_SORCE|nr:MULTISPECIES: S1 RNA-binding domain-containing protein [Sorangium]AUX36507.1 30S ribosomal protein S1 [Sorangium cellulosum]WCQ95805.1 Polyribonucleotide nucleotidyltransferase [Sorangium sp. Soce836]